MIPKLSFSLLIFTAIIFARPRLIFLKETFLLFSFLLIYYAIPVCYGDHDLLRAMLNIIIIQSAYLLGVYINWKDLPYWPTNCILVIIAFSLGFSLFSSLSFHLTSSDYPSLIANRGIVNFWSEDIMPPLALSDFTLPGIMLVLPSFYFLTSVKFITFFSFRKILFLFLFILVITSGVSSLLMNAMLQNRTSFIILVLSTLAVSTFLIFRQGLLENIKMMLAGLIFFVMVISVLAYYFDLNIILALLEKRVEEGMATSRYNLWLQGIYNIFENPLGGGRVDLSLESTFWFHNLWLDIVRVSGVVPLAYLLIFQGLHLKSVYVILKENKDNFINLSIISLLIGIFCMYLTQPILEGSVMAFSFTLFFWGILKNISYAISEARAPLTQVVHQ